MKYNFDEVVNRMENHSAKWLEKNTGSEKEIIPMWIADMDMKTAPAIIEAMKKKAEEGIFGYVYRPLSYYRVVKEWIKRRFDYDIDVETLIHSPGVVASMSILIELLTGPADKVLIQSPVYPPFRNSVEKNGRKIIENDLIKDENGYYTINFKDLEEKLALEDVTLFILCNPHNPVGRVWRREELKKIGELCKKYNVRILADEIWRDLIMPNYKHIPMASIDKEIEDITVTLFSPTKSFNLAGVQASFVTFPRKDEKKRFEDILEKLDLKRNNAFSLVAIETAYAECENWLEELILYLDENMKLVVDFIREKLPMIKVTKPEGTYLMWLDFSKSGVSTENIYEFLIKEAGVVVSDGITFGKNGNGFVRLNVACPRVVLEKALLRLESAITKIANS